MNILLRPFRLHSALWLGLCIMIAIGVFLPAQWTWPTRMATSWNSGVAVFLLLTVSRMAKARSIDDIRVRAAAMDQAGSAILPLSLLAAAASVFVIVFMTASGGKPTPFEASLTLITIALSWFFVQLIFTLRYAHEFYAPNTSGKDRQALMFPGETDADYWDFLHFSLIIGVANQTADVQIASQSLRRIATLHSIVSWLFNTVILALAVNLAVNLL